MAQPNNLSLLRKFLTGNADLVALLQGANSAKGVYWVDLPEKFDPALGPCIVINGRGGKAHPEILDVINESFQIRIWAAPMGYVLARQVYGVVRKQLHGATNVYLTDGCIMSALETVGAQDISDPDSGYATVVAFYDVMARAN